MLLSEQSYTNLNRIYYHGSKTDSLNIYKSRFNSLYLTTSFLYAVIYSYRNEDLKHGKVFAYKLKKNLNIFNARSKKDIDTLKKHFHSNYIELLGNKYKLTEEFLSKYLASRDWFFVFDKSMKIREQFIEVLQEIGYDGFFNYEWQKDVKEHLHNDFIAPSIDNQPAVGIFDISNLQQIDSYSYKDFFKFEQFKDVYKKDKEILAKYVSNLVNFTDESSESIEILSLEYAIKNSCFLEEKEVLKIIDEINQNPQKFLESRSANTFKKGLKGEIIEPYFGPPLIFNRENYCYEPQKNYYKLNYKDRRFEKFLRR